MAAPFGAAESIIEVTMMCPDKNCVWNQVNKTGENVCTFSECIVVKRNRVSAERINLQHKPYLDMNERARLTELNAEWARLMMCGDAVRT